MARIDGDGNPAWHGLAARLGAGLVVAVLAVLAVRSDLAPGGASTAATAADVGVGVAFAVGALLAPGSWRARLPFLAVGIAWLAGSVVPALQLAYLSVLAVALTLFPRGRAARTRDGVLVGLATLSILVLVPGAPELLGSLPPRPVAAALLAAVGVTAWGLPRWERSAAWYPSLSASATALALGAGWLVETRLHAAYDAALWTLALDLVMLGVAFGFPVAAWAVRRDRARLADRLLADDHGTGLDGLAALLRDVLGDPGLQLERVWAPDTPVEAEPDRARGPASVIRVEDGDGAGLAAIRHRSAALDDPGTRASVIDAVRLTALHEGAQAAQRIQLLELEAARGRLIDATDAQRASIAARLRDEVLPPIEAAASDLHAISGSDAAGEAAAALDTARRELDMSAAEVLALTRGLPPAALGGGRLPAAIATLAARCPIPVDLFAAPGAAASEDAETALFYVCSEAIANVIKHAQAGRITIELRADSDALVLEVGDDGRGGADPAGSGLRGLADRLDACGGRLRVQSGPGAGTRLTASVPVRGVS